MLEDPVWPFILVALALGVARLLHQFPWLQKIRLPYPTTGGILLAICYHIFPELPKAGLKPLVVHLLNLFYITIALNTESQTRNRSDVRGTALFILWHYGLQAFIGLGMALLLSWLWFPGLAPVLGLFVPLGYALGPGQAYKIGSQWQDANGFHLGDIGLTFGALGYIWASLGGMLAVHICARHRIRYENASHKIRNNGNYGISLIYIFICYGLGLLSLELLGVILNQFIGGIGLMDTLRSISFIFCALAAWCFAKWLRFYRFLTGQQTEQQAQQSLNYLASIFVRIMVCAGIGSISFALLWVYMDVIAILAVISAALLTPLHFLLARYFFRNEQLERSLVIYGSMMGTTSSGMSLLEILDPHYEGRAARDYLAATRFAFIALLPIIVSLQWVNNERYYLALGLYGAYVLLTSALIGWRIARR